MKVELEKKLFKKYPKIFAQKELPMNQTLMCWGIECPDSWYWIIDNLCHSIQEYVDSRNGNKYKKKDIWIIKLLRWINNKLGLFSYILECFPEKKEFQVEAVQVKEKYGSLRFYTNASDDTIDGMIWLAEVMSANICACCGSNEKISITEGWISYLCPKCKRKKKINCFLKSSAPL